MKKPIAAILTISMLAATACSAKVDVTDESATDTTPSTEITTTTSEPTTTTTEEPTTTTTSQPAAADMEITELMTMLIEASGHSVDEAVDDWKGADGLDSYNYTKNKQNVAQGIVDDRFFFFDYQPKSMVSVMEVIKLDTDSDLYKGLKIGDTITTYFDEYSGISMVCAIKGPYVLCMTEALSSTYDSEHNAAMGDTNSTPPYQNQDMQKAYEAFLELA